MFLLGLDNVAGFWSLVKLDPLPLRGLFVDSDNLLTFVSLKRLFKVRYSESEAVKDAEQDTIFCWEQFLQMCGGKVFDSTKCALFVVLFGRLVS